MYFIHFLLYNLQTTEKKDFYQYFIMNLSSKSKSIVIFHIVFFYINTAFTETWFVLLDWVDVRDFCFPLCFIFFLQFYAVFWFLIGIFVFFWFQMSKTVWFLVTSLTNTTKTFGVIFVKFATIEFYFVKTL